MWGKENAIVPETSHDLWTDAGGGREVEVVEEEVVEEAKAAGAWKPEEPRWGCRPRRCLPCSQKADL